MSGLADLHLREAHEVVSLLREGRVSPAELIDVVERRVRATEDLIHATPITCFERARAAAAALKHPPVPPPGYLYGLPVLIKDTQAVAGVRFTEGSPLFADRIAEQSDTVVLKLEARGAIVVGKTNVPEFAAGSHCFNPVFPTTVSPWDIRSSAGGSSGGAAAGLAACQCWLATGSDLGGSLRTPAAFCGVVGIRVSPGRVPRGDTPCGPPEAMHSVNGPMGRSVRDAALLLDAMEGNEGWVFQPVALPSGETYEAAAVRGAARGTGHWRVAYSLLGCAVRPELDLLCRRAAATLAGSAGAGDVAAEALDFKRAERAFYVLRAAHFASEFGQVLEDPARAALVKPEIIWNTRVGQVPDIAEMADSARADLAAYTAQVRNLFQSVDVICTPATLDAAFDAEVRYPSEQIGQSFADYLGWMKPAYIATVTLCPALVMPCGFLPDGRPVGLQLLGPPGGDALVIEAAAALEAALGLPRCCPGPRAGTEPIRTVGPRSIEEAAAHHQDGVRSFLERYSRTPA